MKAQILHYLKHDRSFETGLNLYQQHGYRMSFKTVLNRQGFSKSNYDILLRELAVENGISDADLELILKTPVVNSTVAVTKEPAKEEIPKLNLDAPVFEEVEGKRIVRVPDSIQKSIKLREQFPFLNNSDCPKELKILVTDMFSLLDKYQAAHKDLFKDVSAEEINEAAANCVEDYLENRAIWDELNHYKETGTILGKHPIFAEIQREEEIRTMSIGDLTVLHSNLKNYILRDEKYIKKNPNDKKNGAKSIKIDGWKKDKIIVAGILGIKE